MTEPTITAEDLALYALGMLEGEEREAVDAMLRRSTAAREELSNIRGDLALFALATEQHTPPALTRQRLLKQVARERRTIPVELPMSDDAVSPARPFPRDAERNANIEAERKSEVAVSTVEPGLSDPEQMPRSGLKAPPTRTFPPRSQLRAGGSADPRASARRVLQEQRVQHPEAEPAPFDNGSISSAGDAARFVVERQSFAPHPQVFPREARALATSTSAHSITMFEQHFATEAVRSAALPELPPDPETYSGRIRNEPDSALAAVEDSFVPSTAARTSTAAREEAFAFSSYRVPDDDEQESRSGSLSGWLHWAGWAAAAAIAVAAAMAWRDDFTVREQLTQQQTSFATAEASAARAEFVMQTLQSPTSQQFALSRTDASSGPSGRIAYLPERGTLVFQGSNLETLQPYKTYELWLLPAGEGRQPIPAGLFKPDGHGFATVVMPQMQKGVVAANFGVTIEDEGGSATPTLPIVLIGQQS